MKGLPGLRDGRLVDGAILRTGPLAEALVALNGEGEETRLIGGAVRDLALGLPAQDFDLATTATPEETMRRGRQAGFKTVPTGIEHGTVTLVIRGRPFETTTLRADVETDGRHAKVVFGRDFDADAERRDFTINALSLDPDGVAHDPVGGLDDLAARRVRFIGDADRRIREDYLRILRFFRFSARFAEGPLDRAGLSAAIRNRDGLERLSRERVRAELLKLIIAPRAVEVVRTMGETGFLEPVLAGMAYPGRFARVVALENARSGDAADPLLRLMGLAVVTAEDVERLRERLRLANAEQKRMEAAVFVLAGLHGREAPPARRLLRALLFGAGREAARDALTLVHAEAGSPSDDPAFQGADAFLDAAPAPRSPFGGGDVIARGVPAGPRVGAALQAFEALWLEADFPDDPAALARMLHAAIEGTGVPPTSR
jgi:poly(A) polymerase